MAYNYPASSAAAAPTAAVAAPNAGAPSVPGAPPSLEQVQKALRYNFHNKNEGLLYLAAALGAPVSQTDKKETMMQLIVQQVHDKLSAAAAAPGPVAAAAAPGPVAAAAAPAEGDALPRTVSWDTDAEEGEVLNFFVNFESKIMTFGMSPDDFLHDLKCYATERLDHQFQAADFYASYGGTILHDDQLTLREYCISQNTTVDLKLHRGVPGGGKRGRDAGGVEKNVVLGQLREEYNVAMLKVESKVAYDRDLQQALTLIRQYHDLIGVNARGSVKTCLAQFSSDDIKDINEALNNNRGARKAAKAIDKYAFRLVHEILKEKRTALTYLEETTVMAVNLCLHTAYYDNKNCCMSWGTMVDDVLDTVHNAGRVMGQHEEQRAPQGLQ
jgi:hypothetical protein